jgi:anti-sigma factor RsiW
MSQKVLSQDYVISRLSDYVEGSLPAAEQEAIAHYLETDSTAAREAQEIAVMLAILHKRVPRREPTLDIWGEFHPKMLQAMAEERLTLTERLKLRTGRFLSNVAAGTILFTQAIAANTEERMRKYLVDDPFEGEESA